MGRCDLWAAAEVVCDQREGAFRHSKWSDLSDGTLVCQRDQEALLTKNQLLNSVYIDNSAPTTHRPPHVARQGPQE